MYKYHFIKHQSQYSSVLLSYCSWSQVWNQANAAHSDFRGLGKHNLKMFFILSSVQKLTSVWGAFPVLLFAILPLASGFTVLRVLCMHFMEKMSLVLASGHPTWGIYIPELVVSGLIGFAAWITAILLAPYIVGIQTRWVNAHSTVNMRLASSTNTNVHEYSVVWATEPC